LQTHANYNLRAVAEFLGNELKNYQDRLGVQKS